VGLVVVVWVVLLVTGKEEVLVVVLGGTGVVNVVGPGGELTEMFAVVAVGDGVVSIGKVAVRNEDTSTGTVLNADSVGTASPWQPENTSATVTNTNGKKPPLFRFSRISPVQQTLPPNHGAVSPAPLSYYIDKAISVQQHA